MLHHPVGLRLYLTHLSPAPSSPIPSSLLLTFRPSGMPAACPSAGITLPNDRLLSFGDVEGRRGRSVTVTLPVLESDEEEERGGFEGC